MGFKASSAPNLVQTQHAAPWTEALAGAHPGTEAAVLHAWLCCLDEASVNATFCFLQGTSSLTDDPVWLLGLWYGLQDADANKSSMTPEVCLLTAVLGSSYQVNRLLSKVRQLFSGTQADNGGAWSLGGEPFEWGNMDRS